MQNLRSFYVNGQLVTVPEDEMDEFMASMQERGETPDEVETYEDDGGNPLHVPVSERDEFMRTMGAQNRPIRNMKTVVMDDGKTLNLGEEDIRQFVQARRQGMPMSRGLLANTGVPDWYGKGREDREALADALGGIYFPEEQKTPENMGLVGFDPTNTKGFIPPKDVLKDEPGGMLDYMKTSKEAQYGRDLNALEATAANLPFVGSVMDSNEARAESVEKRLYSGDFRDSLEASKLALSIGIPQDEVRRVNADANGDQDAMRKGFSDLVSNQLAQRIVTRQKKGDRLNEFDLNVLENAGVGAAGLVKTVAEMSSPTAAAVTIGPSMMNRAAGMADGEWTVGPDGKPVEVMAGDDGDTAMLKGLGGAVAERAVWMNPWMSKWAGAVAKKAGGSMLANNAAQVVDMTLKNDLTDLADNVVGLDKSKIDESKEVEDWAKEHFLPQNLAKDIIHSAVAHVGMKGLRLATKSGREALANEIGAEIERRGALEERRMAQERAAEADAQELTDAKRSAQKAAYDASMSDEAKFALEQEIDAQVKAGSIPEAARDTVREKVMSKVENARSLEDADLREGALMIAVAEMQNPTRVTSPAHERRQTEAKMRENERWAKRSDELAKEYEAEQSKPAERAPNDAEAVAAERTAREEELNRVFSEQYDAWKAERDAAEKEGRDFTTPEPTRESVARQMEFDLGDTRTSKAENDAARAEKEGKAAHDAYEADQQKTADERELADFAKGEADAVAAKRARQADLDAAFADYDSYLAERDAKLKKGEPVKGETQTPEAISNAMRGDAVLQRIDSAYKRAKTSAERNALKEQFKARIEELRGKIGEEPAKTDAETQKLTDEVSKNDSETAKTDTDTDAAFRAWAVGRDGKPLEFATKEDEARSRETFDMLVKMGKVDPQTGKAIEPKYGEVKEPIATESTSASQTPPAASVMKNTAEAETMSDVELGGKIAKAAQDYEWSMSNGRDIRPYKNGMMDLVGKADAHDLGVLIKAAEIETARKFKWKKNYEGKKVEPDHIRAWRELKEEAQRRLNEIEEASGNAPATPPAASAAKEVQPPAPTAAKSAEATSRASGESSDVTTAVTSAQKLLKEKFYADEKTLAKQLATLPAQAPKELRTAYETAIAEAKRRADVREQISRQSMAKKLTDPDFKHWAKTNGRTETDQARRDYDAQQIDALGKHVTKNWLKGVTFRRSENAAEVPTNARQLYSRDGNVVGWYDSAKKEVVTLPGADAGTVAHELGWHATYDHAQERAAAGDRALLDKLNQYANDAKNIIVDPATGRTLEQDITARYGRNGITDPAVLLDEIGAARYTMEQVGKIKDAAARRQAAKWYGRAWNAVSDAYKSMLTKMGWNKARIDVIAALSPDQAVNLLADEMLKGRNLGKANASPNVIDMNKGETLGQWHDRKLKDFLRPVEELEKDAGKTISASAHTKFRTLPGKVQNAINEAEGFMREIETRCKKAGIKIAELNEYLYAQAATERNEKVLARNGNIAGSAMKADEISRILNAYRRSPKFSEIESLARDVLAFQKRGFDIREQYGLISHELADKLRIEEPHHVPMKSRFDANGEHQGFDRNATFDSGEWKTAEGRTNLADGPLGWILQEYVDAKSRAFENDARRALLTTVLTHPEIGSVRKLREGERAGEIRRKGQDGEANVFTVKSNGDTYKVTLNGARGEAIAAALTGRNIVRPPEALQKAMRWWSSTATSWSPTFAGRNFIADTIDVFANNIGETNLYRGIVNTAKHVGKAFKMIPEIHRYIKTGKTNDPLIREALEAGVLMGGGARSRAWDMADGETALRTLQADIKKGTSAVRAVGKVMFGWIDTLNQTAEMMNRLADYKMQRAQGKSKEEAALHSREITVDFNQKGEVTPATNLAYMFSNSSLGSTMRLMTNVTKKGGWQLALGTFALGALEALNEDWMNGDDEEGKNMNEFTRENSIYVRNGKNIVRIPLHKSPISAIKNAGNKMVRVMMGRLKPGDAGYQVGKEMTDIAVQYLGIGSLGDNIPASVVPTILQPFVQAVMNRDYADRPIERKMFDDGKPKAYNGRKSTPEPYKNAAQWLNDKSGGNDAVKGDINVSPEMLKFAAESIGKNAMRDVQNASELILMAFGKSEWDRRNIPLVRDYYRTTGGNDDRYFKAMEKFKDDSRVWREKSSTWDRSERAKYAQERPWTESKQMKRAIERINDLRKMEEGLVQRKTKNGTRWVKPERVTSDAQKESFKKKREELQAWFLDKMGK